MQEVEPLLQQIRTCVQDRDTTIARALCRRVLQDDPKNLAVLEQLALIEIGENNHASAIDCWSAALAAGYDPFVGHFRMADAYFSANELPSAAEHYLKALEHNPNSGEAYNNLGAVHQAQGLHSEARHYYQKCHEVAPDFVIGTRNLASALCGDQEWEEAIRLFQKVITASPEDYHAHHNLGYCYNQVNNTDKAITHFEKAIECAPTYGDSYVNLAALYLDKNVLGKAHEIISKLLDLDPDNVSGLNLMATLAQKAENYGLAIALLQKSLTIKSDNYSTNFQLAMSLWKNKQFREAITTFQRAFELMPDNVACLNNMALIHIELDEPAETISLLEQAVTVDPSFEQAHANLATRYCMAERWQDAVDQYAHILSSKRPECDWFYNLGICYTELDEPQKAIDYYEKALSIEPSHIDSLFNIANILKYSNKLEEAFKIFHRCVEQDPSYSEAWGHLGNMYSAMARPVDSIAAYKKAVDADPDDLGNWDSYLFCLNYHPTMTAEEIFSDYCAYDQMHGIPKKPHWQAHQNKPDPDKRLKIAYFSPDYGDHSIRYFLEPLLGNHNKDQFEVYAYAHSSPKETGLERPKKLVDHWRNVWKLPDEDVARMVRDDGIDIMIDLSGHGVGNNLMTFAYKPAPVTVTTIGYCFTTGLSAMDYIIAPPQLLPAGSEHLFSEKLWPMNDPTVIYEPKPDVMGDEGPLPADQNGYVTFGSLTRTIRINHEVIEHWSEILKAVPNSKLILNNYDFSFEFFRRSIINQFAAHGIGEGRLDIGYESPPWELYRRIDIMLDCHPHNSGVTLIEALYMGIPFITLVSRPSVGRLGQLILDTFGLNEFITHSAKDYIAKNIELAKNLDELRNQRQTLRQRFDDINLSDYEGYTASLEKAYREMWRRWCLQENNTRTE